MSWSIESTHNCQICVEVILVLRAHDLIQVICGRPSRWDFLILLEDCDVRVSLVRELKSSRKAKGSTADDSNWIAFRDAHCGSGYDE